ncbi:MAG: FtsH protease activity modulator HflK [Deltaproteobacteria bacterium]|nr:FtsH protease activity modulator HflK [Deltaproteobacteria bacterium]
MSPEEKQIQSYAVKPLVPVPSDKGVSLQAEQTASLLTGDENLVIATLLIQYTIDQPKVYLYHTSDADGILKRITQQATIIIVAGMSVDEVLTTGRLEVQSRLKKEIQSAADAYELGIRVASVQIQTVQPPTEVVKAFRDVASAREDKHKLLQRGRGERNRRLPKARGEANMMVSEAIAYANEVVEMAHGDAQRFLSAWEEYRKAKTVTAHRLYYETLEEVFPKVKKAIFNPEAERLPTIPRTQMSKELDLSE